MSLMACREQPPEPTVALSRATAPVPIIVTAVAPQPTSAATKETYPLPAPLPSSVASYPEPGTIAARETSITLSIAFTNDVNGKTDPCG